MNKRKGVVIGHSPGHFRDEVLELIERYDRGNFSKWSARRMYHLLGKLWDCTDMIPSSERELIKDILLYDEPWNQDRYASTYAQAARYLRPVLKQEFKL
jgi:hypothetical protein